MIIDKKIVITGSYNFTKSAEVRNAEKYLFIRNEDVANTYEKEMAHRLGLPKTHAYSQ